MLDSTVKLNSVLNGPLAPLGRGLGERTGCKIQRASIAGCDAGASYPAYG
ncbi:Uncharacterised protein [Escherichia coli]|nr:Uncharacterised protein [Escherichia coli]CAD5602813.1 Uncharacterised protein [Escherichia coli]